MRNPSAQLKIPSSNVDLLRSILLLILMGLATTINCSGQSNVYSLSIYAGGVSYEHDWTIGSPPHYYGLSQYSQWENSSGQVIIKAGQEAKQGAVRHTFTRVYFGQHDLAFPVPILIVAVVGFLTFAGMAALLVVVVDRLICGQRLRKIHPAYMKKFMVLLIFVLTASAILADSGETSLRPHWASRQYTVKPFPKVWRPNNVPPTERELSAFQQFNLEKPDLSIRSFISRYGLPDRYLFTQQRDGQDFLIYDLPSGHSVALYISKPPREYFSAAVIIDAEGYLIRLIK